MGFLDLGVLPLIVLLDVAALLCLSVFLGVLVSGWAGRSLRTGAALGLVAPLLGPAVWAAVVCGRGRRQPVPLAQRPRPPGLAAAALLGVAATLLVAASVLPWARAAGRVQARSLELGLTGAATPFFATLLTASILTLVAGAVAAGLCRWTRASAAAAACVGALWLVVTLDGLLLIPVLGGTSTRLAALVGQDVQAELTISAGLWVTLLAAVAALGAVPLLARAGCWSSTTSSPHTPATGRSVPAPAMAPAAAPAPAADAWSEDW